MDNLDFITIKNFHTLKDVTEKRKRPATDWDKTFAYHMSDNGLHSEYIKNFYKFT